MCQVQQAARRRDLAVTFVRLMMGCHNYMVDHSRIVWHWLLRRLECVATELAEQLLNKVGPCA
jgi:hypothetical protein